MSAAVSDLSVILGSVISMKELDQKSQAAAKLLFPSCRIAEMVFRKNGRSIDCPLDVILGQVLNCGGEDVCIKNLSPEFADQITSAMNNHLDTRELKLNDTEPPQLIVMKLTQPKSFNHQQAEFIIVADSLPRSALQKATVLRDQLCIALNRIDRLEQLKDHVNLPSRGTSTPLPAHPSGPQYPRNVYPSPAKYGNCITSQPSRLSSKVMELIESVSHVDPTKIQGSVMDFLFKETASETGFLVLHIPDTSEYVCHYVRNRIDDHPICIDLQEELYSDVLATGRSSITSNLSENQLKSIQSVLQSEQSSASPSKSRSTDRPKIIIHSMICCPILAPLSKNVEGLVFLFNKIDGSQFTHHDDRVINECLQYTLPLLRCSLAYENERIIKQRTEEMLEVAGNIFTHMMDLTDLLLKIMQEARNLTKAERCSVFLLETERNILVAKVLDGLPTAPNKTTPFVTHEGKSVILPEEIRLSMGQGIAGHVATTGEILNIRDAYTHPLFYRGVDDETGFRTKNILCFPIKNERNGIVGVAQLCNKIGFPYFTKADEDVARAFSVYCCISIVHSLMYKHIQDAQHRIRLANELMMYHMQVPTEKVKWLAGCSIPSLDSLLQNPTTFNSIPRDIRSDDESYLALLSMFEDLGMINRWRLSRRTLAQFILMVYRGYRDPPYHNWTHAFSVCHFIYVCEKQLSLVGQMLTDMEFFALFVASLCHDIDHRGTNNSFQLESNSLLAALYSSEGSVLERHHFSQTICLLNTEGCNIFESLSEENYTSVLDLVRDIILATDLAHHLNIFKDQNQMIHDGYDMENRNHHKLLLAFLMTSADLSDQTKNWRNTTYVARLIYEEFFRQGDMEKGLGHNPVDSMDRDRAFVPQLQISFLDVIILPLYVNFVQLFPEAAEFVRVIRDNRSRWESLLTRVNRGELNGNGLRIFQHDLADEKQYANIE